MKIISYNVNGIRAALNKGFINWLKVANPDVLCLQETKAMESQVDTALFEELGYHHFWFSAKKKGYSGVAILSKEKPNYIAYGTDIDYMDIEGRNIRIDFDNFSVMSIYFPSGANTERLKFKHTYMDDLFEYISKLQNQIPNLIVCGDYNICHQAIDLHDPIRNAKVSGFLPEERAWIGKFMKKLNFIDSFRYFNDNPNQYSWWSYRANARNNNKGWRLDYAMVSQTLEKNLSSANMLAEVKHSDHCPIVVDLNF